jgi:hypothetical protein
MIMPKTMRRMRIIVNINKIIVKNFQLDALLKK